MDYAEADSIILTIGVLISPPLCTKYLCFQSSYPLLIQVQLQKPKSETFSLDKREK